MIALALAIVQQAQVFPTISPIETPTPVTISERVILDSGLADAAARAKSIGASLGVQVLDLTTGASAQRDASSGYPMAGTAKLPLAILAYRAVDSAKLSLTKKPAGTGAAIQELLGRMLVQDDAAAQSVLTSALGGTDAVNTQLRELGYDTIFLAPDGTGFAPPDALARLLANLAEGKLLHPASTKSLIEELMKVKTSPQRLRAGLGPNARLGHVSGSAATAAADIGIAVVEGRTFILVAMLRDGHASPSIVDSTIAGVARAAQAAASAPTP
jgi:beta-lactamase class A